MANAVWTAMAAAYIHGNGSCRAPESTDNRACGGLIKQKKIVPYLTDLLAILVRLAIPCVRHPCDNPTTASLRWVVWSDARSDSRSDSVVNSRVPPRLQPRSEGNKACEAGTQRRS